MWMKLCFPLALFLGGCVSLAKYRATEARYKERVLFLQEKLRDRRVVRPVKTEDKGPSTPEAVKEICLEISTASGPEIPPEIVCLGFAANNVR